MMTAVNYYHLTFVIPRSKRNVIILLFHGCGILKNLKW